MLYTCKNTSIKAGKNLKFGGKWSNSSFMFRIRKNKVSQENHSPWTTQCFVEDLDACFIAKNDMPKNI